MMRGCFITGTDTGVGKTTISRALLRSWSRRGLAVTPLKPCETGVSRETEIGEDLLHLERAAGRRSDPSLAQPYRFALPASPTVAAERAGVAIDLERLVDGAQALGRDTPVLVEGAGGLLVPLTDRHLTIDLVARLELPLVVVARTALGTINHTLLTIEAAQRRKLPVAGIVLVQMNATPGPEEASTAEVIQRFAGVGVLGTYPHVDAATLRDDDALATLAERHLALSTIERAAQIQPRAR